MQQANTWIEAASDQRLGVGVLHLVDDAAGHFVGTDCDVVTVPSDVYRYATMWAPFARILARVGGAPATSFPIVLFFPSQEAVGTLLEPLLIHELGHSAVARHGVLDRVLAHRVGKQAFDRPFSKAATILMKSRATSRVAARLILERQLRTWLTEFLCDAFGVAYAGPAYAYAFAAVVSDSGSTEVIESHPPTSLRMQLILNHLAAAGWDDEMRASTPTTHAWLSHLAGAAPIPSEPQHAFLIDVIKQFVLPIWTEVASTVGAHAFAPVAFALEAAELAELLARRILPAQLLDGRPSDRRAVILAGWHHVLASAGASGMEGDRAASLPKALDNQEFAEFLDKALEMSAVLAAWKAR
jgi:hypothetical protein